VTRRLWILRFGGKLFASLLRVWYSFLGFGVIEARVAISRTVLAAASLASGMRVPVSW
jgi:hypothetical protein